MHLIAADVIAKSINICTETISDLLSPYHEKMTLMNYADNGGLDQTAQPRSLI